MLDAASILALVVRELCAIIPELDPGQLGASSALRELGANSIDRADLVQACLEQLDLDVPMRSFAGAHTLGQVAAVLEEHAR